MQNESGGTSSSCPLPVVPGSAAGPGPDIMASVNALFASTAASASDHSGGFVFRSPPLLRGDLLPPAEELCRLLQHRRGKGGRQPASDPRLDPRIDSKKAKRILANRQSAARSKMKQKAFMDGLRAQQTLLKYQKDAVAREVGQLAVMCKQMEEENTSMVMKIQALSNQYRIQNVLFAKLCEQRNKLLADAMQSAPPGAPAPFAAPTAPHALLPTHPAAMHPHGGHQQPTPILVPQTAATMAPPSLLPAPLPQQPPPAPGVSAPPANPTWGPHGTPGVVEAAGAQTALAAALQKAAAAPPGTPAAAMQQQQLGAAAAPMVPNPALWHAFNGMQRATAPASAVPVAMVGAPESAAAAAAMDVEPAQGASAGPPAAVGPSSAAAAAGQLAAPGAAEMPQAEQQAEGPADGGEAAAAGQASAAAAAQAAANATAMQRSCNKPLPAHMAGQRLALPCA